MLGRVSRFVLLVVAVATTGCRTVQRPAERVSAGTRYGAVLDSLRAEQALERAEAPHIRLVIPTMSYTSSGMVDASFHLSDDAYVRIVALDLDRRIRVLFPESSAGSGFVRGGAKWHRLMRFHAGFGTSARGYGSFQASYARAGVISPFGGGGIVLAVASARPLQLERLLDVDGDWNQQELERMMYDRSLAGAALALAHALVLTGQEYHVDYATFGGGRTLESYTTYATLGLSGCDNDFSVGLAGAYSYGGYGARTPRFIGLYRLRPPGLIPAEDRPLEAEGTRMAAPTRAERRIHVSDRMEPGIEPSSFDPRRSEPTRVEPVRVEPARVEPARVEPTRVEPACVEPARVESTRVEPVRSEPARPRDPRAPLG